MLKPVLELSAETVSGGIVRGITYTQVCRGFKTMAGVKRALEAAEQSAAQHN